MESIQKAKQALDKGEIASVQLVEKTLASIKTWEPHIHAFLEVLKEDAMSAAKQWDKKKNKTNDILGGIPIGIKDVICTLEGHTTVASKILEGFKSPYEATAVKKLKDAGAIIIGKLNCDEFAMGASTEYSAFGVTANPWDKTKVSGGSSGGSAAAVASGELLGSLGTETGGSIRHPASFCGTVGLKPSYGRVSRFGAISYASSTDQIGPLAGTVYDTALLLEAIAGIDPQDATSSPLAVPEYTKSCGKDIKGITIGVPKEYFGEGVNPETAKKVKEAIKDLEKQGCKIKDISLPLTDVAIAVYYLLAKAEGSSNLSKYDAIRYGKDASNTSNLIEHYIKNRGKGFGPEVKRTIIMGTYTLSAGYADAWYKQASKVRTLINREFTEAFKQVDVIIGPTTPTPAFAINSKNNDPLAMYMEDALLAPVNITNNCAMSVPCGFSKDNLPIGMHIIAPAFEEERLFQVGHIYEQTHDWYKQKPKIPT